MGWVREYPQPVERLSVPGQWAKWLQRLDYFCRITKFDSIRKVYKLIWSTLIYFSLCSKQPKQENIWNRLSSISPNMESKAIKDLSSLCLFSPPCRRTRVEVWPIKGVRGQVLCGKDKNLGVSRWFSGRNNSVDSPVTRACSHIGGDPSVSKTICLGHRTRPDRWKAPFLLN